MPHRQNRDRKDTGRTFEASRALSTDLTAEWNTRAFIARSESDSAQLNAEAEKLQ
jgi:hypothetical protein